MQAWIDLRHLNYWFIRINREMQRDVENGIWLSDCSNYNSMATESTTFEDTEFEFGRIKPTTRFFLIMPNQMVLFSMPCQWYECGRSEHKRTGQQRYLVVDEEILRNYMMIDSTSAWQRWTVQLDLYNWQQIVICKRMCHLLIKQFVWICCTMETAGKRYFE